MPKISRFNTIKDFVIKNIEQNPKDISHIIATEFKISRQAANSYLLKLAKKNIIFSEGRTRSKRYYLAPIIKKQFDIEVNQTLNEDVVWRKNLEPLMKDIKPNVEGICHHGFTEMYNNVIDHANAKYAIINYEYFPNKIKISIKDDGIGIFNKITNELKLENHRHAILELSKGKLTTDKNNHTGDGIFFTSRMFDEFSILSSKLFFAHIPDDDWLLEDKEESIEGTYVTMIINPNSSRTAVEVFDKYGTEGEFDFSKTHVPVKLAIHGKENLVSRSQAKRLLARFDRFKEVFLDFSGIDFIGQAFADEIFRVFKNNNPNIAIVRTNVSENIERMIKRVESGINENQLGLGL